MTSDDQHVAAPDRLEPADPADPASRLRLHRRITLAWFVFWAVVMLATTWLWARTKRAQLATRAEAV